MFYPGSGWVPSFAVGKSADRELARRCWEAIEENLVKLGLHPEGLIVHQDQDTVYTSYDWLRALLIEDGVVVSYCEHGAKDNPWMESFWGHGKGEHLPASRVGHLGGALVGDREADGLLGLRAQARKPRPPVAHEAP
jgi:hypothetical protein